MRVDRWADPGYLLRTLGHRTVPVEVGEHYLAAAWSQSLMTFAAFLRRHVEGGDAGGAPTGYLAQHPLFEQVPALKRDIMVRSVLPPAAELQHSTHG